MQISKETLPIDHLRKQISTEAFKTSQFTHYEKLPSVHLRSTSQQSGLNEVLSRDISHRFDLSQKPKTSFETMEKQLRGILGIKQDSCKLPTDLEEVEKYLKKSFEADEEGRVVHDLERIKINVMNQKEKFIGKVVKEGGLLYRTQSGLLQPQMCRLYEQIVNKGAKKGRVEVGRGDMELGAPSGRKEVEILIAWLENMNSVYVEEEGIGDVEKVRRAQIIYTACFKEVVRQVSVQCIERGVLIQRIWNASVDLSNQKEDLRIQQMRDLQKKVQNITDSTISDLKSRCEKAEKFITQLKKIIEEKEREEECSTPIQQKPPTPELKIEFIPFDTSFQRPAFKRNTSFERKKSIKSSLESSVQSINDIPVAMNQSLILFGYIDDAGIFHKQKIIHKNPEGVHVNQYFDEVIEIAKTGSIGTSTEAIIENSLVYEDIKEKSYVYYVKLSNVTTQYPEYRIPFQISKQFNSRILIKPIKSKEQGVNENALNRSSRLLSVNNEKQGVSEKEISECESDIEDKIEKNIKIKGKGKIGVKKNVKSVKNTKRKNEFKINLVETEMAGKVKEENTNELSKETRPKSKSQLGVSKESNLNFFSTGRNSEFSQRNLKNNENVLKSPEKQSDYGENNQKSPLIRKSSENYSKSPLIGKSGENKLKTPFGGKNVDVSSRSNMRTQRVEINKTSESSDSEIIEEDQQVKIEKKNFNPEKKSINIKKSKAKPEKSPIKSALKPQKLQQKIEISKNSEKKSLKVNASESPEHFYTHQPDEMTNTIENPKNKKNLMDLNTKFQEEPMASEKEIVKATSLKKNETETKKSSEKIGKSQSKNQSPLKGLKKSSKPGQIYNKTSKKGLSYKSDSEYQQSPVLTLEKACQVQIDCIPSEDLTRAQVLSTIQQLKKTLVDITHDSNKSTKLLKDTRAFKRATKLSTILKNLFKIPEVSSNTLLGITSKVQHNQFDNALDDSKIVIPGEIQKEREVLSSENEENSIMKTKKSERSIGSKAYQRGRTSIDAFTLGVINRKLIITHPGQKMLSLVIQSINSDTKIRPSLSVRSLIKTINAVYSEKISILKDQSSNKASEISMVLYDFLINMYGLKTVAENKFKQVIISTLAYSDQYARVNNFSKFLNIHSSYTPEDWNFYLNIFETLDYNNFGLNICNEVNHYSALQSLSFCIRQYFERKIKEEKIEEIILAAYNLANDQQDELLSKKKYLKSDLVNTDKLLDLLLRFYYKFKDLIYEKIEVSISREEFIAAKQFLEIMQNVGKKEGSEKIFEAHCIIKKDEGEISKVIRMESVLNILFDYGLIEL